ncbi:hypothetical protein HDU76_012227 [Blyttiomyces sp. JEL0837]|nr:hypothetical protein HDU76_012227 [Blyttiomyces sp. JEL0837]
MMPLSLKHANSILKRTAEQKTVSRLIEEAEGRIEEEEVQLREDQQQQQDTANGPIVPGEANKPEPLIIGGHDLTPAVEALETARKVLEKAQPFLVAAMFLVVLFKRRK